MSEPKPTWWDHHQMTFWVWATIADGEAFLATFEALDDHVKAGPEGPGGLRAFNDRRQELHAVMTLSKHHFVATAAAMMRVLKLARPLFPEIHSAYDGASHLHAEARGLRNMLEHAEGYLMTGGQGEFPSQFTRDNTPPSAVPGDEGGTADATSIIRDSRGVWLGGRFNVQKALAETRAIQAAALTVETPGPDDP